MVLAKNHPPPPPSKPTKHANTLTQTHTYTYTYTHTHATDLLYAIEHLNGVKLLLDGYPDLADVHVRHVDLQRATRYHVPEPVCVCEEGVRG